MARNSTAYMPLWVGDYLADTQHLTTVEHGTYLLLIMHYWRNGPFSTDKRKICRISGQTRYSNCLPILAEFFTEDGGKWHHKRVDAELEKAKQYQDRRSSAGKAGAKARWDSNRIAIAYDSQSDGNGTHNHTNKDNKYFYIGRVFRLTQKSMDSFKKFGSPNQILEQVKKADAYYDARIADGHEKNDFRFSSTAFFKLSSWLEKSHNQPQQGSGKPRVKSAI